MFEAHGDLFDLVGTVGAVVITTNGFVKKNGECVMGRGCANQAAQRWPHIPQKLGSYIGRWGNRVMILDKIDDTYIVSFPVKPVSFTIQHLEEIETKVVRHMQAKFRVGSVVPGWAAKADPTLIVESARQLFELANKYDIESVALPRPGCGAGELHWNDICGALEPILDDRFTAYTF